MKEIKQNCYFTTIGTILFLVLMPIQAANSVGTWDGNLPDNNKVIYLGLSFFGFIGLYFSLYGMLLKNQLRKSVHPHMLANTLILVCIGGFFLVSFFLLEPDIGDGWFALIAGLYIMVLFMFVLLGKALKPLVLFLVLLVAIVAFHYL